MTDAHTNSPVELAALAKSVGAPVQSGPRGGRSQDRRNLASSTVAMLGWHRGLLSEGPPMMNKGRIVSGVLGMSLLGLGATSGQSAVLLRATAELSPHSSLSRSSFSQVGVGGLDGAAPGGV